MKEPYVDRGSVQRFSASARQRDHVKAQVAAGMTPFEIDSPERAARRADYLHLPIASAEIVRRAARERAARRPDGEMRFERIIGRDELMSVLFLTRGAQASRTIGCIAEGTFRFGTGFLVGPRLLLTNHHVLERPEQARGCTVSFNYEDTVYDRLGPEVTFDLDPAACFVSSPAEHLDYTLVGVKPVARDGSALSAFGFLRLNPGIGKILVGEKMNVIQHPDGRPKQVVIRENRLTALLELYLHYETDTNPGSSGSPVFNDQWDVVGLHHSVVPERDAKGNYIGNEGIRISRIIADIQDQASADPRLRAATSELVAWPAEPTREPGPSAPAPTRDDDPDTSRAAGVRGRIVVPFSLTLGTPTATLDSPSVVIDTRGNADRPEAPDRGRLPSVSEMLSLLEENRRRRYYDASADEAAAREYYQEVRPSAADLRSRLETLLVDSHATELSYRTARVQHLYSWVDLQRNGMVRSIYSDLEFDPAAFIREDFEIERRREEARERLVRERRLGDEELETLLEAREPFNCEHVVPQSWFRKGPPMQGDLHHLYTCEADCNSFRGNRAYRDFGMFDEREARRKQCGFSESDEFEPFMGKGKVARATLYFILRYPGQFNATGQAYGDAEIATLLDWHRRNEVAEHEQHRNAAIFEIQGNRNPLIDHPEWADAIFR